MSLTFILPFSFYIFHVAAGKMLTAFVGYIIFVLDSAILNGFTEYLQKHISPCLS